MGIFLNVLVTTPLASAREMPRSHKSHAQLGVVEVVPALSEIRLDRILLLPAGKEVLFPENVQRLRRTPGGRSFLTCHTPISLPVFCDAAPAVSIARVPPQRAMSPGRGTP